MTRDPLLYRGYRLARREHAALAIDYEDFARHVLALTRARMERAAEPAVEPLARVLERLHHSDLYLALACDRGCEGALERFLALYSPRLLAFLGRSGVGPARASGLLHDLEADLTTPPPDRRARTRFGTYTGAASLQAWLTAILLRRRADLARRAARGGAPRAGEPAVDLEARPDETAGPLEELLAREAGDVLARALGSAHAAMTARERAFLACRIERGLAQREIARLLGVGAPRVSRLQEQALAKLKHHLRRACLEPGLVADERLWPSLRDALGQWLGSPRE